MPLYSVKTKLSPEETVEKAIETFGPGGLGLEVTQENPCCVTFEGGGGHVTITASGEGERTTAELETREWDYHVQKFMREIA
jgi:hypothetical protein